MIQFLCNMHGINVTRYGWGWKQTDGDEDKYPSQCSSLIVILCYGAILSASAIKAKISY